jgi:uncharacterized protein YbjT (DUF2867 family)
MASTLPVLVIGSTGNVGMATIQSLSTSGVPTRAGVRDVKSDKAIQLAALDNVTVRSMLA